MNQDIRELYDKVAADAGLQEKLGGILENAEKQGKDATESKLVEFAREAGYEITIAEMKEFFEQQGEKMQGQLSDAELDMVAGGKKGDATILVSVLSAGIGCAMVSAWGEAMYLQFQGTWDGCQKVMTE